MPALNASILLSGLLAPPIAGVIGIMATLLVSVGLRAIVALFMLKRG